MHVQASKLVEIHNIPLLFNNSITKPLCSGVTPSQTLPSYLYTSWGSHSSWSQLNLSHSHQWKRHGSQTHVTSHVSQTSTDKAGITDVYGHRVYHRHPWTRHESKTSIEKAWFKDIYRKSTWGRIVWVSIWKVIRNLRWVTLQWWPASFFLKIIPTKIFK